jgi:hypothetical protein
MATDIVTDPQVQDEPAKAPEQPKDDPVTKVEAQSKESAPASPETAPQDNLPKWTYSVPAPLRDSVKDYATIGDAVRDLVDLRGRAARLTEIPGAEATIEEREAFYKAAGRPDSPAGYELKKPVDWPNNMPWDQKDAMAFAEHAYKAGLPKAQAETLYRDVSGRARNMVLDHTAAQQRERQKWADELVREYGENAEVTKATAHRAVEVIGSPALKQRLEAAGLLEYPPLISAFARAWNAIGEDRIFAGAADPGGKSQSERIRSMYPNTQW